ISEYAQSRCRDYDDAPVGRPKQRRDRPDRSRRSLSVRPLANPTETCPSRINCSRAVPVNAELWRWRAGDLAKAICKRQISSREAVTSCLARLEHVNPRINAVVDVMADDALAAAAHADKVIARGEAVGPLHGVPVTIKINVDCVGRATTNGVVAFKDRIAETDSPPVANWRKAGAIVIGRTNVPSFTA